jgi:type IV pilus assembly protein PilE
MYAKRGFTLVELMVVVAIAAILAAIAYPSYLDVVRRAHQSDAQQFMMDVALREEQFILDSPGAGYAGDLTQLNFPLPAPIAKHYSIAIATVATPPAFTITATPASSLALSTLTLDSLGNKSPAGAW